MAHPGRLGGLAVLLVCLSSATFAESLPTNNLALVMPYTGAPLIEASAEVVLQAPAQVDDRAPVPVRVRVLQPEVEWISLLADGAAPELLARVSLEQGALPEFSTRFFDPGLGGVQAVVTLPGRYLAKRRLFRRADAPELAVGPAASDPITLVNVTESVADSVVEDGAAPPVTSATVPARPLDPSELQLQARRSGDKTLVRLSSRTGLIGLEIESAEPPGWARELRLYHRQGRVLVAELSPVLWFSPFFQFALSDAEVGDTLVVELLAADGNRHYLSANIEPPE